MRDEFEQFCKNIRMSDSLVESIQTKYHSISTCINRAYWDSSSVNHSLYVGSYGRGTSISASDIDILVFLPLQQYYRYNGYTYNGQSHLLQNVKNTLQATYPRTNMKGDGQVISVNFGDICFEVVPAFEFIDGDIRYPDTNNGGRWKSTNPRAEIKEMDKANKMSNKNLKHLCRMIRSWNYFNGVGLPGDLIDSTCYHFIKSRDCDGVSYSYYDWMCRDYFKYVVNNKNRKIWSMPGSNRNVDMASNMSYHAKRAYNLALQAIEYARNDRVYTSCLKWREVFGTKFPG